MRLKSNSDRVKETGIFKALQYLENRGNVPYLFVEPRESIRTDGTRISGKVLLVEDIITAGTTMHQLRKSWKIILGSHSPWL